MTKKPAEGEMARLIDEFDWAGTSIGPKDVWSPSLRLAVNLALLSHAQIVFFAGDEYIAIYNDAYAPTIGSKHPSALGHPARDGWSELWSDLEPLLARVRATGETVSAQDRPFFIERKGYVETVYFDISYSPVREPDGTIEAVMCIVSETTDRVKALAAERRLSAIVASSMDAILGTDLDQRITAWNRGAEKLYGYSESEVLGRPVTILVPPECPQEEDLIMAQIMSGMRIDTHETRRLHKDGRLIDVSLTVSPIHDSGGLIVGASKIARDISGRKKAERLQRLLLGELNHRVKNVLATVQVIARQSFEIAAPQQSRTFFERLGAMARAHDLLTRESWEGATMASVATGVAEAFGRDRFDLSGPDLGLPPRSVVALAMALHELATNAAKYGALSVPRGRVMLEWHCSPDEGLFELRWEEKDGPAVCRPDEEGFGSMLIRDAVATELDGEVELTYAPTGVTYVVRAPINSQWDCGG